MNIVKGMFAMYAVLFVIFWVGRVATLPDDVGVGTSAYITSCVMVFLVAPYIMLRAISETDWDRPGEGSRPPAAAPARVPDRTDKSE